MVDVKLKAEMPADLVATTIADVRFAVPRRGTRTRAGIITNDSPQSSWKKPQPTTKQTEDAFWFETNGVSFILSEGEKDRASSIQLIPRANDHGVRLRIEFETPSGGQPVIVSGDLLQAPVENATEEGTRLGNFRREMAFTFGPRTLLARYEDPEHLPAADEQSYKAMFEGVHDAIASYPLAKGQQRPNRRSLVRDAHRNLSRLTDLQLARLAIETSREHIEQAKDWDQALQALIASFLADGSGRHAAMWSDEASGTQYVLYSSRAYPSAVMYRFDREGRCSGVLNVRMDKDTAEDMVWSEATKLLGVTEP